MSLYRAEGQQTRCVKKMLLAAFVSSVLSETTLKERDQGR